jgi:hypothetical protein
MEEALRTLEDEPLKGRKIRLEKVCDGVTYLRIGGYSCIILYLSIGGYSYIIYQSIIS